LQSPRTLTEFFRRNGYVRRQDPARLTEGSRSYRKGEEVRLVAISIQELKLIRRLLREAGLKPGRPWRKDNRIRQPIYGRDQVERLLQLVGEQGDA
jgi:hypothetical protein